jgi:tripartite-type tricarboxylate transporter receptor subunit TctC
MTRRFGLALALAAAFAAAPAAAQFPTRPVTIIVPFAAGGPSDAIARLLAVKMGERLGQQFIVENVAGAGGTTGAARLARAAPDGHTILIHHIALPAGASLYRNLPYDTAGDLVPLGLVNTGPMLLLGRREFPARTGPEVVARMRAERDRISMAHAGVGSNSHLSTLLLQQALDVRLSEVAYRGTGPAMTDLIAGHVDLLFDQATTAVPQIRGGAIQVYAVTATERLEVLPDVPTTAEIGLPQVVFTVWHGLYAPRGTPAAAVEALHGALQVALDDPQVRTRFAEVGTTVFPAAQRTREAHARIFQEEIVRWREVTQRAGVRPE